MTTPSAPTPSTPAAATPPASAPTSEPAASSAAPSPAPKGKRAALADSLVGIAVDDDGPTPEQPAAPTFTPDTPATPPPGQEPPPPAGQSKLAALQAKLLKDRQEREAKRAQDDQAKQLAALQADLDKAKQQPTMDTFLAEFSRAPAATLKKYNLDPRKYLALLTDDALAPGSVAAQATAQDAASEGKRALEAVEQMRREQAEREEVAAGNRHNLEFLQATSDTAKYPRLAALENDMRLELALETWRRLNAEGHPYDRDMVADLVEARLDAMHTRWTPPAPAPPSPTPAQNAPSSPTSAAPTSHAATKQPPKTITPALAGASSGTARRQTPKERREALANSLVAVETD